VRACFRCYKEMCCLVGGAQKWIRKPPTYYPNYPYLFFFIRCYQSSLEGIDCSSQSS
jgi:hypothetical protein